MKSYSKANDDAHDRVKHLLKLFHPSLHDAGLKIDLIFVATDDEDGAPALTHNRYPAMAVVKVLDAKARVMGRGDAEIVIDEARYAELDDAQKDALLDHEIYHIELQISPKSGRIKRDECNRPKLSMRLHDRQYGWFDEIARRHGIASGEVQQANQLVLSAKQLYFEFEVDGAKTKLLK